MQKKRVLVIEDDAPIRQGILDALEFENYLVIEADNGEKGLELALQSDCDLILLDLILPGPSGLEILKKIRENRATLPVIILTACGEENDRVQGLRLGADDYVVKPFSVKELMARIVAVLRRTPERPSDVATFQIPGGIADFNRCEVRFDDGERCELSEREMELLSYLVRNAGRAISRQEILSRVWHLDPNGVETRTIDMHIVRLREKLRDSAPQPKIILTVRGKGYMYSEEVTSR